MAPDALAPENPEQPRSPEQPRPAPTTAAAFFDLDKTIIAKSSSLAFARPFSKAGLMNRRAVLRSAYAQFVFLAGGANHDQMEQMREYLSAMVEGWDAAQVREIVGETLHDLIEPVVYAEAAALISEHRQAGHAVVIVSSSGSEVVEPIAEMLGIDRVVATRIVVGADGRYTREIEFYAYAEGKADAMRAMAAEERWDLADCYAYSDSATDLPMLRAVGHPFAVNPDKALRAAASEHGWPVLDFATPVSARRWPRLATPGLAEVQARLQERVSDVQDRVQELPPRHKAAAAATVGAAAAGLVWYAARRQRPGA